MQYNNYIFIKHFRVNTINKLNFIKQKINFYIKYFSFFIDFFKSKLYLKIIIFLLIKYEKKCLKQLNFL